jgi:diaminohydroxyphosphoribosylaminopyrimidine deaminase / 5-amino-6-(5-phosphoribosylamino)uracil reductase
MRLKTAEKFMRISIEQAKLGRGRTGLNPLVGCIVVKNNKFISSGFHKEFGGDHAEVIALRKAGKRAKGASLFVTLEPCSYYGKTPPCTDMVIKSGIKEVFCGSLDPNPLNRGRGIDQLKKAGIKTRVGILKAHAEQLNTDFINRMKQNMPFVTLKLAQSMDGKIATRKNDSKWISSEKSRGFVQGLRKKHDAVMVGINTVLHDDPLLSIRKSKRQPIKIIIDSNLKMPLNAKLLRLSSPGKTIIGTTQEASEKKAECLRKKGVEIIRVCSHRKRVDLKVLMRQLVQRGIGSILTEGGGELAASMLETGIVDKVYFFISPIIIGGKNSISAVGGKGAESISQALRLSHVKCRRIDRDFLLEADVYRNN